MPTDLLCRVCCVSADEALSPTDAKRAASHFLALSQKRRTLRFFDPERRPELDLITDCVLAAGTAPSGAHKQPWSYVIVRDAGAKRKIRDLVEQEEQTNYQTRMAQSWVSDLMPMMSNLHDSQAIAKPYLTEAPFLCCVFAQPYGVDADGRRSEDHYYVSESVGISLGIFLTALHSASLCSLVTTPMCAAAIWRVAWSAVLEQAALACDGAPRCSKWSAAACSRAHALAARLVARLCAFAGVQARRSERSWDDQATRGCTRSSPSASRHPTQPCRTAHSSGSLWTRS